MTRIQAPGENPDRVRMIGPSGSRLGVDAGRPIATVAGIAGKGWAHEAERYRRSGLIDPIVSGVGRWLGDYDEVRGLWGRDIQPEDLVV